MAQINIKLPDSELQAAKEVAHQDIPHATQPFSQWVRWLIAERVKTVKPTKEG